jgi:hypothetical protein
MKDLEIQVTFLYVSFLLPGVFTRASIRSKALFVM